MLNFELKTGLVLTLGILAGVPGSLFAQPGFRKQLPTAPLVQPIQNNFPIPGTAVPGVNQGAVTGYIVSGSNGTNIQTTSPTVSPYNGSGISALLGSPYNPSTLNGVGTSGVNINNVPINPYSTTGTTGTSSTSGLSSISISNLPSNASALTPTGYPYTTLNTNSYPFTNQPYYNPYLTNPATNPYASGYLYPPGYAVNPYAANPYAVNPYAQPMYYNNPAFNNPLANPAYINQAFNALLNSNPFNSLLGINNPGNNNVPNNNNFMNNPFNPFNNGNGVFGNMGGNNVNN